MLAATTTEQIEEWLAEYEIEPWDGMRFDLGVARIVRAFNGEPMIDNMPFLPDDIDDDGEVGGTMRRTLRAKALAQQVD